MSDPVRTDPAPRSEGPASLVSDVMRLSSDLLRKEIALAKAEVGQNLSRAGNAVGFIAVAGVIGLVTLNVLVAALVAALAETDLGPIWSAVIVGVVLALVAFILLKKGLNDLKLKSLMPTRTVDSVQRDAHAIKEAYHDK